MKLAQNMLQIELEKPDIWCVPRIFHGIENKEINTNHTSRNEQML